uniref:CD225/dispanin family protein n=1 Tax=Alistipes sp. TaxID=1872444 RepID=UPI0040571EA5
MTTNTTNQKPDNYLIWAILSTLFCCLPLGVVAVIKSNQVDSLWLGGHHDEAIIASNETKKWLIIAICAGVAGAIVSFFMFIIMLFA